MYYEGEEMKEREEKAFDYIENRIIELNGMIQIEDDDTYLVECAKTELDALLTIKEIVENQKEEIERRKKQAIYFSKERNKKSVIIDSLKNKLNDSIAKDKIRLEIKECEIAHEKYGVPNAGIISTLKELLE